MIVFHLAFAADWDEARRAGAYRMSTRGRTLDEEGFVHCSRADQVATVAANYYAGATDLVLLHVDTDRLTSEVRVERVGEDEYPHVYGPIDVDAVVEVTPYEAPAG